MKKIFLALFSIFFSFFCAFSQDFNQTRPLTRNISAKKTGINKILLQWTVPQDFNAASIAVFRDTKPISTVTSILSLKPVAELPAKTTKYTDQLERYGEYFYALIARDRNGNLINLVVPDSNALIKGVKLLPPEKEESPIIHEKYQPDFLRNLPLPYLDLIEDIDRKPTVLKAEAMLAARNLSGKYYNSKPEVREPYIFEDDLICAPEGDDYYLFQSLKTYFIKKDYKNSVADLKKFLSIARDPYTTTRAVFYLAESQYYVRNYRAALLLFLFSEDELPELSKKWIDSTLDLYQIPTDAK